MTQEKPPSNKELGVVAQVVAPLLSTIPQHAFDDAIRTARLAQSCLSDLRSFSDSLTLLYCRLAYVAAATMSQDRRQWDLFIEEPYWIIHQGHKPKSGDHEACLKWVMVYVFGAEDDNAKDRARIYAGALQVAFDAKQDANELVEYVKGEGGIDHLYRRNLHLKKKKKQEIAQNAQIDGKVSKAAGQPPKSNDGDQTRDGEQLTFEGDAGTGSCQPARVMPPRGPVPNDEMKQQITAIKARGLVPLLVAVSPTQMAILSRLSIQGKAARLNVNFARKSPAWFEAHCIDVEASDP